ncbi:heavy-metal-associated domain-containing protein [Streptomyces lavendulocolor]|uniref:Heavy-metal-associated domain-containing protein n=1 Tax=Streptomyces lavendulocolor TaxID=67316 RepID=A0ABV2W4R8_9ACTN|nr:metal-binding protein [Streptomyces cellulosae]
MSETTYTVTGMTCDHCADAITKEISDLPGVQQVKVDVPSGRVTVTSESPLATEDVRAAVVEAGEYELVSS